MSGRDIEGLVGPLAFEWPVGETIDEWRENARKTGLYQRGDTVLVWVNEGDLYLPPHALLALKAENDGLRRERDEWAIERAVGQRQLDECGEALLPFAALADEMERVGKARHIEPGAVIRKASYAACVRARAILRGSGEAG